MLALAFDGDCSSRFLYERYGTRVYAEAVAHGFWVAVGM